MHLLEQCRTKCYLVYRRSKIIARILVTTSTSLALIECSFIMTSLSSAREFILKRDFDFIYFKYIIASD